MPPGIGQNFGAAPFQRGLPLSYYPKRVLFAAENQSLSSSMSIIGFTQRWLLLVAAKESLSLEAAPTYPLKH